jgi:polysaccharide biosynthesis transport protein
MDETIELTLRDVLEFVRRGLLWALLLAVLAATIGFALSRRIEPTYLARATLVATHLDPSARAFGTVLLTAPPLDAGTYRTAILSRAVIGPAVESLTEAGITSGVLGGQLAVTTEGTTATTIIRIEVRSTDAARSAAIANAVAEAAVRWDEGRATRTLETIIDALQAQIEGIDAELSTPLDDNTREGLLRSRGDLSIQLSSARALRNAAVGRLEPLEAALTPQVPIAPNPRRTAVVAGLLAAVLAYAVRLARQILDVRVRSVDELGTATGLPILTEFPTSRSRDHRLSREAASYLRTNLLFDLAAVHPKVILVTGYGPNHGKSSVAITLAESFAMQGYRTLLMDADLRRPVTGAVYQLEPERVASLLDALGSDVRKQVAEVRVARGAAMDVYPSFAPVANPTELLGNRLGPLLARVKSRYDVIVLDSAPLLPVADTLAIAPHASAAVFVVSMRDANRRHIKKGLALLQRAAVPVVGLATTFVTARQSGGGEGYGYGYGGPYEKQPEDAGVASPSAAQTLGAPSTKPKARTGS